MLDVDQDLKAGRDAEKCIGGNGAGVVRVGIVGLIRGLLTALWLSGKRGLGRIIVGVECGHRLTRRIRLRRGPFWRVATPYCAPVGMGKHSVWPWESLPSWENQ